MAFEDYDQFEQSEQVRKWIKDNFLAILTGVVLALALIFGYRQWQSRRVQHQVDAAAQYAILQNAIAGSDNKAMTTALGELHKSYADTAYAAFGSAAAAQYKVGKDQLKEAASDLEWAIAHAGKTALQPLFSLRLARVQMAQDQAKQALSTLDAIPTGEYAATRAELRGDALLQLKQPAAALVAYQDALAKLDPDAPERNLLQMKLDNLTQPAAASSGTQAK